MKFHSIKYRQPVFGDSRCALYVLANLFDDAAFLLFNNVGEMTSHNQERDYVRMYSGLWSRVKAAPNNVAETICNIHPFALVPSNMRIDYEHVKGVFPDADSYILVLLDHLRDGTEHAHTIGVLWGNGSGCIVIDPQKNEYQEIGKERLFEVVHVVGFRMLCTNEVDAHSYLYIPEFPERHLPHIFAERLSTCSNEVCPPIPADVTERETKEIREFCKSNGAYIIPTRKDFEDHFERVPQRIEYRNIRHEVTYKETE